MLHGVIYFYVPPKYLFPDLVEMPRKPNSQRIPLQKISVQWNQSNPLKGIFIVKMLLINQKQISIKQQCKKIICKTLPL